MQTAKYNYEMPPMVLWNEVELKIELAKISEEFGVAGDMEIDSGHSFSYSVTVFFPPKFQEQIVQNQFAPYDAVPSPLDPQDLLSGDDRTALRRDDKTLNGLGNIRGAGSAPEAQKIQRRSKDMNG